MSAISFRFLIALTVHGQLLAADNTHAFGAGVYVDNIVATITY